MKIAFLLTQSLDSPSGLGRFGPLAYHLAEFGHQVDIYALHPDLPSLREKSYSWGQTRVHYVAPMHVQKQGNLKSYYPPHQLARVALQATLQLSRSALSGEAEILQVCKPHPMNGMAGWLGKSLGRKRLFVDCDDYESASNRFGAGWQQRGVAFFERWLPPQARGVTTNTTFLREKLAGWGVKPEKIVYLPNGVEPARFPAPDPAQVEALRRSLGLQGKQVIAFFGSLSLPSHPVDLLLQAFARVAVQLPKAALLLVGGGEDYETLQRQAQALGPAARQVCFTGRVPPDQVSLYYRLADVSVDPVRDDEAARGRSPLKLFESWASEVPFITADVGDRRSLMEAQDEGAAAGLLARPGDPDSLAEAIQRVLTTPTLASQLRQAGRERLPAFTWERLARRLERLYLGEGDLPA